MVLIQYQQMPFGIYSAPAVFQRTMDTLFKGLRHVTTYIDDIVVTGATEGEHLKIWKMFFHDWKPMIFG